MKRITFIIVLITLLNAGFAQQADLVGHWAFDNVRSELKELKMEKPYCCFRITIQIRTQHWGPVMPEAVSWQFWKEFALSWQKMNTQKTMLLSVYQTLKNWGCLERMPS